MSLRAPPVSSFEDASAGPEPDGGSQATNDHSSAGSLCKSPGHAIKYKKRDWESTHGIAAHGAEGHQFKNVHIKGDARVHLGNQYTISDNVSVLYQHVQYLQLSKAIHQRQNILAWLSPINVAVQHSSLLKECQEGTGQWLLQSTEFETWMQKPGETLLCKGMPGAGLYIDAYEISVRLQAYETQVKQC